MAKRSWDRQIFLGQPDDGDCDDGGRPRCSSDDAQILRQECCGDGHEWFTTRDDCYRQRDGQQQLVHVQNGGDFPHAHSVNFRDDPLQLDDVSDFAFPGVEPIYIFAKVPNF